jgi:hypothetical protein
MDEVVEFALVFDEFVDLRMLTWPVDRELLADYPIAIGTGILLRERCCRRSKRKKEECEDDEEIWHRKASEKY